MRGRRDVGEEVGLHEALTLRLALQVQKSGFEDFRTVVLDYRPYVYCTGCADRAPPIKRRFARYFERIIGHDVRRCRGCLSPELNTRLLALENSGSFAETFKHCLFFLR